MKHLKLFFALFAMLALGVGNAWAAESLQATLDFTTNAWNLPTTKTVDEQSFTNGGYTIKVKGTTSNGYQFNSSTKCLLMGKSGATLTLPAFDFTTTKIVVTGKSGASGSVKQNIFVDSTEVSTATTGATGTNTYEINSSYQAAGNVYVLKVTSAHNTQITKIEVYGEASATPPTPTTQYTVKWYTALGTSTDVTLNEGATITKPATEPEMTGYEFMGWTDQCSVAEDGTGFTALTDFGTADADKEFYAVFAVATTTGGGGATETSVSVSIQNYASANSWANGTKYTSVKIDENITASVSVSSNTGKYYTSGHEWRLYQTESPTLTLSAAEGKTIKTATITYNVTNNGVLKLNSSNVTSGTTSTINASSVTYNVGNSGSATNGQVKVTAIEVVYTSGSAGSTTYSNYTTTCSGATVVETLADAQFAWSAATAEATMGATNTFPTLTNTVPVSVTYESSNTDAATIEADGTITLVAPGTTTISAKFAGGEVSGTTYAAKTVTYTLTVNKAPATPTGTVYVKTTNAVTDGEYLIVYEDAASTPSAPVIFDGSLATLDATGNMKSVTISDNVINGDTEIDAATFTISAITDGFAIKSKSGKYIGRTSSGNGMNTGNSEILNTITITDGVVKIAGSGSGASTSLQYYSVSGQERFRYYGTTQKAIALYKKASEQTVTIATCENGSVSASVANGAKVLSGTTITLENTPATNYKLAAYDVYKTDDAATKVAVNGNTFVMPEFDVTISATFELAKTLTSIEITNAATQTTFWQGETFNYTGLVVTAHFSGAADEVVTPTVTGSTATAGAAVEVTVSYTEGTTTKTATYTITVKATANTEATAYDVTTAREIIDKVSTANDIYVQGIVSEIVTAYNATYGNITYNISADGLTTSAQLQAFRGKSFNGDNFTSANDVKVGDEVVVFGNLLLYNSTYELAADNKLISLNRNKAAAGLAFETTEYTANVNEAFTAPTLTNPNGLTVTYSSSDATLATVNTTTGAVTILDKTGKVTITATFAGDESYLYGTASYNITISDPSLTEATFDATVDLGNTERGEGEITKSPITFACTDGVLGNGSEYRIYQNAAISFTAENGYAITKVVITSTASGTSQYGPGLLSTENGTYSVSDKTGTWVGEAQTVTFTATAQSRAKLITVYYKTDNRQDAGLVWSTENMSITLGDAFTVPTLSNPNGLTLTCTSDNETLATVSAAGVISVNAGVTGKATITAKFDGNSNYKDATVTCTITVNPKTEIVVILAQYNGQWYALKNVEQTAGKVLAALPVNYVGGKLYNVEEADKTTIEWQRAAVTNGIIFKNGENYIYGTAGNTDLKLSTTECAWTLDGSTYKIGDRTFIYRAQANGFKNYNATTTPGTDDYSNLPVVTAPVYATGDAYGRSVNLGTDGYRYGTICLPFGSTNFTGAEFFECVGKEEGKVFIGSVTTLVAGTPYIFLANATEVAVYGNGTTAATAGNSKGLYGTFENETVVAANDNNHILLNNKLCKVAETCWVNANRAYLVMSEVPTEYTKMPGRRYIGMDVEGENEATGFENITAPADKAVKAIINGQLIIIRDGEMYNAMGVRL